MSNNLFDNELLISFLMDLIINLKSEVKQQITQHGYNLTQEEINIYILIIWKNLNTTSKLNEFLPNSHKSNISRNIKNLMAKDLVQCSTCKSDKRIKYFICADEQFKRLLEEAIITANNKYKSKVSTDEYVTFLNIIKKMNT